MKKVAFALLGLTLLGGSAAQAQYFAPYPHMAPQVMPYQPAPVPYYQGYSGSTYQQRPVFNPHQQFPQAPHFQQAPRRGGMGVDLSPVGPFAGAGVASGLGAVGVPAPIAGWAGGRVNENFRSAGREQNLPDAAVRGFTGVSPRDIREHGWRGGRNSEVNKVLRGFGL